MMLWDNFQDILEEVFSIGILYLIVFEYRGFFKFEGKVQKDIYYMFLYVEVKKIFIFGSKQ